MKGLQNGMIVILAIALMVFIGRDTHWTKKEVRVIQMSYKNGYMKGAEATLDRLQGYGPDLKKAYLQDSAIFHDKYLK